MLQVMRLIRLLSLTQLSQCLRLKPATLSNIRHGKAEGRLTEDDLQKALELTKKSNRNSIIMLKAYNIK